MGKLRFVLTSVLFWVILVLSCLLAENYALFSSSPKSGLTNSSLYILSFGLIALLIIYYVIEHKKNKLSFDKILLPFFIIIGILLIWTIFRQDTRTFTNWAGDGTFSVSFTLEDRIFAALQVVIWLAVIYALTFVYNRYRLNNESYRWPMKINLLFVIGFTIFDFFYEFDAIKEIFSGTYIGPGLEMIFGNANVWGLYLFTGIVSALVLSYKKFNWYYFVTMICLFCFMLLTTSATCIYVSLVVLVLYTLIEIFTVLRTNKIRGRILFIVYIGVLLSVALTIIVCANLKVPLFSNLWDFIEQEVFHKNFNTLTGRTEIWDHIFDLLKQNPLDLIFGLGHQTGTSILSTYIPYSGIKSAHNGVMEIMLRYGLLGVIIYAAILVIALVYLIINIKNRRYRFAFIYGLAFIALLAHSIAESTLFFTPNVGGVYFGGFFVLPIIAPIQKKKIIENKNELLSMNVNKIKVYKNIHFVLFVYAMFLIAFIKIFNNFVAIEIFSSMIIFTVLFIFGIFILAMFNNQGINEINNYFLNDYINRLKVSYEQE